jgi:IclR family transcriptional regulator, acetate operon repressor
VPESVQSIDRAFAVLRQVAIEPGGISGVARAVDLPVSTVARLLGTLEALGAVARIADTATYGIGPGIRALADANDASTTLVIRAGPVLSALAAETGETSGLAVIEDDEVVYLAHAETTHQVTVRDWTGTRLPLHVVSSGLVLLAAQPAARVAAYLSYPLARLTRRTVTQPTRLTRRLASIQREGHAWTAGEFDEGITSVAAPVIDRSGGTVAAIHTHGPSYRFPGDGNRDAVTAHVVHAARTLGAMISSPPGSVPRGACT